jgi:hypothetical protein
VLFGRGAMRLGGILVMFRCLIVSIFRHGIPPLSGDVKSNEPEASCYRPSDGHGVSERLR